MHEGMTSSVMLLEWCVCMLLIAVERSTVDTRAPAETVITGNAPKAGYSKGANVSELQTEKVQAAAGCTLLPD